MICINCYSSPHNLLTLQKQRLSNAQRITKLCWQFYGYSTNKHAKIITKVGVFPIKMEHFPTSLTLAVAAKPPDVQVLFQTSALLIFVYLVANFVVPQFLSKSLEFDKDDKNEQPKSNSESADEEEASSTMATKKGFNGTKPK